ncbi:PDZ domain-containing protein, partial [Nonlabens mediterrranea]|nr:PDZ domain-containing protein [Nonlabens mediterrranea]
QRYVDNVNTDSIVDLTVNGILSNLDPHSVYISNDEMEDVSDQMRGDFVGIGIRFFVNQDTISVLNVLDGGPSKKAGIKGGDKILYADGKPLFGLDAVSTDVLKGEDGSKVTLGVLRPGDRDVEQVSVVRGSVPINSVEATYMLDENMGYIKVNRFAESTEDEFNTAIDQLIDQGAKRLTVDLRDNPGGVLSAAIAMADEFLPRKKLILFTW